MSAVDEDNCVRTSMKESRDTGVPFSQKLLAKHYFGDRGYLHRKLAPNQTLSSGVIGNKRKDVGVMTSEDLAKKAPSHTEWALADLKKPRNGVCYYKPVSFPKRMNIVAATHVHKPSFEKGRSFLRWDATRGEIEVITVYHDQAIRECLQHNYTEIHHHAFSEIDQHIARSDENIQKSIRIKEMFNELKSDCSEPMLPLDANVQPVNTIHNEYIPISELSLNKPKNVLDLHDWISNLSKFDVSYENLHRTYGKSNECSAVEFKIDLRCKEFIICKFRNLDSQQKVPTTSEIQKEWKNVEKDVKGLFSDVHIPKNIRELAMAYKNL
jgi:hypothetical protein